VLFVEAAFRCDKSVPRINTETVETVIESARLLLPELKLGENERRTL
jgi:hypothetical protein